MVTVGRLPPPSASTTSLSPTRWNRMSRPCATTGLLKPCPTSFFQTTAGPAGPRRVVGFNLEREGTRLVNAHGVMGCVIVAQNDEVIRAGRKTTDVECAVLVGPRRSNVPRLRPPQRGIRREHQDRVVRHRRAAVVLQRAADLRGRSVRAARASPSRPATGPRGSSRRAARRRASPARRPRSPAARAGRRRRR